MWLYSHVNHTLKGYTHRTHEAIIFEADAFNEVPDSIGEWMLGTYPLEFCPVDQNGGHICHRNEGQAASETVGIVPSFPHREIEEPPVHRQMLPFRRKAGRPRKRKA